MKKLTLLMLIASRLADGSTGQVNLKDGSYHLNFATIANAKLLASLNTNYSSRRLGRGLLGPGWCTHLDIELRRGRGANMEIQNCDHVLHFSPLPGTALSQPEIRIFQLQQDSPVEYRLEQLTDGSRLVRRERTLEGLTSTTWNFTKNGQLLSLQDETDGLTRTQLVVLSRQPEGLRLQLNGQLVEVQYFKGANGIPRLGQLASEQECHRFRWNRDTFIDLQNCHAKTVPQIEFSYDSNGNMNHVKLGEAETKTETKTETWISFDTRWDRVTQLREKSECYDQFTYESAPNKPLQPQRPLWRSMTQQFQICPNTETLIVRLEVQTLMGPSGQTLLRHLIRQTAKQEIQIDFHPLTGQWLGQTVRTKNGTDSDFKPRSHLKTRMASDE